MSSSPIVGTRLGHSMNSRGEFGLFVDPSSCECGTCTSYRTHEETCLTCLDDGGHASSAPSPSPGGAGAALGRSATNADWMTMETSWVSEKPFLPAPSFLMRSNAFVETTLEEEEEDVLKRLSSLRGRLLTRQDTVYAEEPTSHRDMAMADQEWSELDEKIAAIEGLLTAFRYPFRTR